MSDHHSGPGTVSLHRWELEASFSHGGCLIIKIDFFYTSIVYGLTLIKVLGGKVSHLNVAKMYISCLDILSRLSWEPGARK